MALVNITLTVDTASPVTARVAAIAQAHHSAKFTPPAVPTVVTDVQAVKELIRDYLIGIHTNDTATTSQATAQATVAAAIAQAQTDAAAAIT